MKVVVTLNLGPKVMPLLNNQPNLDVSIRDVYPMSEELIIL